LLNKILIDRNYTWQYFAANNYWKLSPGAEALFRAGNNHLTARFQILFKASKFVERVIDENPTLRQKNNSLLPAKNILTLNCDIQQIEKLFLNNDGVVFIDVQAQRPQEELGTPGYDLSANKINRVHRQYPGITGIGQHVSIKEDYYDTTDIDIKGRYGLSPLASANITNHANFMATIIAGAGNSASYAKGAAYEALISSSSFAQVLPDADNIYLQNNITVQNHSYGTAVENNYGIAAVAFDKSANKNDALLHVFSSGNSGTSTSTVGNYAGIAGYANLTGNFKMAKNILTVGAVDSFGLAAPLSSKGPAYDGRIKPDLVAFQQNGTSEAAALVSGTTLLMQQYYHTLHPQNILPSTLAKAILINTADDIDAAGPDFKTGYGNLNALKAMDLIRDNKIFSGNITQGEIQTFSIAIPANISLLKIALAWNDTAASPLANKALVNDLDLVVEMPANNLSWKSWVLNSYANIDSLQKAPVRKRDSLNNAEQVTIQNPAQGNYDIKIAGYNLPTGSQKFHVVYCWDSLDYFKWQRPGNNDLVEAGTSSVLRWENSFGGNGTIEYTIASSNTWNTIVANTDLSQNHIYWDVPDTIAQAIARMKIGSQYFYSDTFLITTLLKPGTGYICGDSILIYWNKLKNIGRYQLYQLRTKYMEPLFIVNDTTAVILKAQLSDKYLAVAPVLNNGMIAQKSYGFNYATQGAGCYIDAFYADRNNDSAKLTLSLGTLINLAAISFEKLSVSGYATINNPVINSRMEYIYNYGPLAQGINYFRAKITLTNGQIIYSNAEAVYYAAGGKYVLLPIPVNRNSDITLITALPEGEIITLFDVLGRSVFQQEIQSSRQVIKTSHLPAGQYFYHINKKGIRVASGKIMVL
jgi:hypothetical protein